DERREKTDEADAIDAAMSRLRGPEDAEEHRCAHEPSPFGRFLGRWRARTLAIRDSPRSGGEEERTAEEAGRKDSPRRTQRGKRRRRAHRRGRRGRRGEGRPRRTQGRSARERDSV